MSEDEASKPIPHWDDLPADVRQALIERARSDLFWRAAGKRFIGLKVVAQVVLALTALWFLAREGLADFVRGLTK